MQEKVAERQKPVSRRGTRADAQKNRQKLIEAARAVFSERGAEAPLQEVADLAGVGIATLYRSFPRRDDLLVAMLADWMEEIAAIGSALLRGSKPIEALREWLLIVIKVSKVGRRLAPLLIDQLNKDHAFWVANENKLTAGAALLTEAQRSGSARADVRIGDVLRIAYGLSITTQNLPAGALPVEELLDIVLAGLLPAARRS